MVFIEDNELTEDFVEAIAQTLKKHGRDKLDRTYAVTVLVDLLYMNEVIDIEVLLGQIFKVRKQEFEDAALFVTKEGGVDWLVNILKQVGQKEGNAIVVPIDAGGKVSDRKITSEISEMIEEMTKERNADGNNEETFMEILAKLFKKQIDDEENTKKKEKVILFTRTTMTQIEEFKLVVNALEVGSKALASSMTSSLGLKEFAVDLISLTKIITDLNEEYEMSKVNLDNKIDTRVMDLMMHEGVKYKNKAEMIAQSEQQEAKVSLIGVKVLLDKAEMLIKSYDRLFQVAHTEYRYLAKDMATANMHQQYENMSHLPQ